MTHYPECPKTAGGRSACACPVIDAVLDNAMRRFKAIDLTAYPSSIVRDRDFRSIVRTIAAAIRPEVQ